MQPMNKISEVVQCNPEILISNFNNQIFTKNHVSAVDDTIFHDKIVIYFTFNYHQPFKKVIGQTIGIFASGKFK